jgi:hypothetical protein
VGTASVLANLARVITKDNQPRILSSSEADQLRALSVFAFAQMLAYGLKVM